MNESIVTDNGVETDALYDCSAQAFAERFGRRVIELMRQNRPCGQTARLAFSYAERALRPGQRVH